MLTVEELRDRVCDNMDIGWVQSAKLVDSLIAAVRRAERKRIWDKGTTLMVGIEDDPHVVFMVDAGEVDPKRMK